MTARRQRVAAYGVCVAADRVLLTRFVPRDGSAKRWSLPGGGVEHAEDPFDAVVREVHEESGYQVEVDQLLGVDSRVWLDLDGAEMHGVGLFYRVRITGGELRHEVDGSSDLAAWFPLVEVPDLPRAPHVDVALALNHTRPATGHLR